MKFNIYIVLSAAFLWFTLTLMFAYRASWSKTRYLHFKGPIKEIGISEFGSGNQKNILAFKLDGFDGQMGIYRKSLKQYDTFSNNLFVGDTIEMYYDNWKHPEGSINTQVVHLQKGTHKFIRHSDRKRSDCLLAIVFGLITAALLMLAIMLHKRNNRPVQSDYSFTIL